ncbi:MAG: hypothetical protein ABIY70_24100 [Capsulimonas sp.]|uniref:hypothetical protein n=1 Tax=Capsulimonas sp. TaxID=2494211 RepID=UPI003263EB92
MDKRLFSTLVFLLALTFALSCRTAVCSTKVTVVSSGAEHDEYAITGHKIQLDVSTHHYLTKDTDAWRGSIFVSSKIDKRKYRQKLLLPHGLWPVSENACNRATVFLWEPDGRKILVALLDAGGGFSEERVVSCYRLRGHEWRLMHHNSNQYGFTCRGGFYVSGRKLFIWDFVFDDRYAYFAPAKYRLRQFIWKRNTLTGPTYRTTRRRYETKEDVNVVLPEQDALRELGMRWRWWAPLDTSSTKRKQ